ncbi:MAG: UPF0175 family protein [Chloroflexota bacterium]
MTIATRQLNIRVPPQLVQEVDEIADVEGIDRSAALKRLIAEGIRQWKVEYAVRLYREGRVSKARAAELAGVSLYEMIDLLRERAMPLQYNLMEAREDIRSLLQAAESSSTGIHN